MTPASFSRLFDQSHVIISEGAVIERLRRNTQLDLDPHVVNAAFIYDPEKRSALETIYRQYLDIGVASGLPLLLSTPTWRASRERIQTAGYEKKAVNEDNYRFLDGLRRTYGAYADKVAICGLMSCRGDAYNPAERLSEEEARGFHAWQAQKLAETGVDFLLASTLPALSEAMGIASAQAATGKPYIISFVFRPQGTLLDGTPLKDAVAAIDAKVNPKPLAYLCNCTHASIFRSAMMHETHVSPLVKKRVVGLLANTAALEPEELDNSEDLVTEAPETFGHDMANLHTEFGLKILGGCCGTDHRHIQSLAEHINTQD
jgi:S-methylmethionine-dependent homocysteine/selenocysteine methylase